MQEIDNEPKVAAEAYSVQRMVLLATPVDRNRLRLLLELAFMEGAAWHNRQSFSVIQKVVAQLERKSGQDIV